MAGGVTNERVGDEKTERGIFNKKKDIEKEKQRQKGAGYSIRYGKAEIKSGGNEEQRPVIHIQTALGSQIQKGR